MLGERSIEAAGDSSQIRKSGFFQSQGSFARARRGHIRNARDFVIVSVLRKNTVMARLLVRDEKWIAAFHVGDISPLINRNIDDSFGTIADVFKSIRNRM